VNALVEGEPVLAGEINGVAYLIEDAGTYFAGCWSLLARSARELDALVIGSTYEAPEDHCEFFAARGPQVVRAFWNNSCRATRPFSQGEPLPSEAIEPLFAAGGRGLKAALEQFGFPLYNDKERDLLPGERWVLWKGDLAALMQTDEMREQINNHVRLFANPAYRPPIANVRVRKIDE
jgi:hypothetical protein